ncbi:hypothetical protein O3P69_007399 [Scylla paramamosain]|uniref:Uncharacterized protein n=1 Tax=Scylla paramamosain TaxID=85552 RepID=A0AAW0V394_SCYPA
MAVQDSSVPARPCSFSRFVIPLRFPKYQGEEAASGRCEVTVMDPQEGQRRGSGVRVAQRRDWGGGRGWDGVGEGFEMGGAGQGLGQGEGGGEGTGRGQQLLPPPRRRRDADGLELAPLPQRALAPPALIT